MSELCTNLSESGIAANSSGSGTQSAGVRARASLKYFSNLNFKLTVNLFLTEMKCRVCYLTSGSAPNASSTFAASVLRFEAAMCRAVPSSYSEQGVSTSTPWKYQELTKLYDLRRGIQKNFKRVS